MCISRCTCYTEHYHDQCQQDTETTCRLYQCHPEGSTATKAMARWRSLRCDHHQNLVLQPSPEAGLRAEARAKNRAGRANLERRGLLPTQPARARCLDQKRRDIKAARRTCAAPRTVLRLRETVPRGMSNTGGRGGAPGTGAPPTAAARGAALSGGEAERRGKEARGESACGAAAARGKGRGHEGTEHDR